MNKFIFKSKDVERFFAILENLGRSCCSYYKNQDCQKTVFVRRVFKKFHPYWIIEIEEPTGWYSSDGNWSEELKFTIQQYILVSNISYYLGHGEEIQVSYWQAGTWKYQELKLNYNTILKLKGKKITKEKYEKISGLFIVEKEKVEVS